MSKEVEAQIQQMTEPFIANSGFELVDVEFVKEANQWFLRIFVDKEGGIDIEDCAKISEQISKMLDEQDPISQSYFLEVSSPGAERPLRKEKDFYRAVGKHVHVSTYEAFEGMKQFEGTLLHYDKESLTIEQDQKSVKLPIDKVAKARLAVLI